MGYMILEYTLDELSGMSTMSLIHEMLRLLGCERTPSEDIDMSQLLVSPKAADLLSRNDAVMGGKQRLQVSYGLSHFQVQISDRFVRPEVFISSRFDDMTLIPMPGINGLPPDKPGQPIGYLRLYFRDALQHTWFTDNHELNDMPFKFEFNHVMEFLQTGPLKNLDSLAAYCRQYPEAASRSNSEDYWFVLTGKHHTYHCRLRPVKGDYVSYIYCYRNEE